MEGYRRKWERNKGMEEDVVKLWKRTDESVCCMNGMEETRGFAYGRGTRGSMRELKGWRKISICSIWKRKDGSV